MRRTEFIISILMILTCVVTSFAQRKEINVGSIHMMIKQDFDHIPWTEGDWTLTYPGGWYHREQLVGTEYRGARDELEYYSNYETGETDSYPLGAAIWTTPYTGYSFTVKEITDVRKYPPPTVTVDGIIQRPFAGEVEPDLPSDQMLSWVNQTDRWVWAGAQHKIKAYAFANPDYDDFIIFDYTIINNLDWDRNHEGPEGPPQTTKFWFTKTLTPEPSRRSYGGDGLYPYNYSNGTAYGYDTWNSYMIRQSELVPPGTTPRDSLLIQYGVDANAPDDWDPQGLIDIGKQDDFGDPFPVPGHPDAGKLLAPCYIGYCTFLLDKDYNGGDDPSQPFFSGSNDIVTELWSGPLWPHGESNSPSEGVQFYTDPIPPLRYDASDPNEPLYAGENPWTIDPTVDHSDVLGRTMIQTHGPIELAHNDSMRWVWAIGIGSMDQVEAIELGKKWWNDEVTDEEKNSALSVGYDSLFHNLDKAYAAWTKFQNTGDFGIALAPPSPDLTVTAGPAFIGLDWEYSDASLMPNNFQEWRIYQKEGHFLVDHPDDVTFKNYELVKTITDPNTTSWQDDQVVRGIEYHYFVTCVAGGIEGSKYDNRTLYPASSFLSGEIASLDKVRIVPNPYRIDGGVLNFSDNDEIKFFGLPQLCTLKIYNETGDLIKVIEHQDGSADESWNQITESNQYVAPGVYILLIENAKTLDGKSINDGQGFQKFVILR